MNDHYCKTFPSMYTGSMYGAGFAVFAVWEWLRSHADKRGVVECNPIAVGAELGGDPAEVKKALAYLQTPDDDSRSKESVGKRIIQVGQYEYEIVNYCKYRDLASKQERLAYQREWDKNHRKRPNPQYQIKNEGEEKTKTLQDALGSTIRGQSDQLYPHPTPSDIDPTYSDNVRPQPTNPTHIDKDIDKDNNTPYSPPNQNTYILNQIIQAIGGDKPIIGYNEQSCLAILDAMVPPLTVPELDPILDWLRNKRKSWSKRELQYRPSLEPILRMRKWNTVSPVKPTTYDPSPINKPLPMCRCGRGPEMSVGTPLCIQCVKALSG